MSNEKIMSIAVHKATINLKSDETLQMFTEKLSGDGRYYIFNKLKLITNKDGAWLTEVFSNVAIFSAYKNSEPVKYYAIEYKRNEEDKFEFGKIYEVGRVIRYEAKDEDDNLDMGLSIAKSKEETNKNIFSIGDWKQIEKSFWEGIV